MKILIVSATKSEIIQTMSYFSDKNQIKDNLWLANFLNNEIIFLITGIGSYATIYELTKVLSGYEFDMIINAGIAGAYDPSLRIGDVVCVRTEEIGDLGVNDRGEFKTVFDKKFLDPNDFPFIDKKLVNPYIDKTEFSPNLKHVKGLTVNSVSGDINAIEKLISKFDPQVESMEGAAFFYVCLIEKQKFLEIRSISNYVEHRNRNNWQILKAINTLNENLKMLIFEIIKSF